MAYHLDDTIVAIASASGGAARGIVRLGGPAVVEILEGCFKPCATGSLRECALPAAIAGEIATVAVVAGERTSQIPTDVYLWPGERSYTRQPVAELHTIGSPPLLAALVQTLCAGGARLAEPGEFTLRAFLNGRLDLTEAEAVLGVIDSTGPEQLDTALGQLAGGLARPLHDLRENLLDLLAELEAGLDFVEEDIEFISPAALGARLEQAAGAVAELVDQMLSRTRAQHWPRIVLVGSPNVGKSSLFNVLATGAAALVSDRPGTTRDYLLAPLDLDGLDCELVDTAGVVAGAIDINAAAQRLAGEQSRQAQVRVLCLDSTRDLNAWERQQVSALDDESALVVLTKCDRRRRLPLFDGALQTSAVTGSGLAELRAALRQRAAAIDGGDGGGFVAGTAARCRESLRLADEALGEAQRLNTSSSGEELVAAEIRLALDELGKVVGAVYTDDILDRIFSRFCIGK